MKKLIQLLTLNLFVLMLITSCTGTTNLGFNGGDGDGGGGDDDPQNIPDAQTLTTSWSQISAALFMAGGTEAKAIQFEKEYSAQIDDGKSVAFSAAYAALSVQGKSEEEAILFAREQDTAPRDLYYYAALAMCPEAASRLLAVYQEKLAQGNSEAWAQAYARKLVLEEKNEEEARAYADEWEVVMERLSTMAQPGDMEEQGLTAELYRIALRVDLPTSSAKLFADTLEAQLQAGKSDEWAAAYASMIARGQSADFARTYAGAKEAQLLAGKSNDWAKAYAEMIADGESADFARAFADSRETGKSVGWAKTYASMIAQGQSDDYARAFAGPFEAQLLAGKSVNWAAVYANMIARGQSDDFARAFAGAFEAQLLAGKSGNWAKAYATAIAVGRSPQEATAYADRQYPGG